MDLRKVKKLIELAEEAGLAELEVTSGDESVRIALARPSAMPSGAVPVTQTPALSPAAPRPSAKTTWVPAPMAGTFYQAPNPDAEPFVRVGDTVQAGEVLCIIESMKMMHEIKAPVEGVVVAILGADGEPISTGDRLFELS
tara:strand:+ start:677 stop:1099 length:423 start_codon:yes stop_codon:yes gene_type:complete